MKRYAYRNLLIVLAFAGTLSAPLSAMSAEPAPDLKGFSQGDLRAILAIGSLDFNDRQSLSEARRRLNRARQGEAALRRWPAGAPRRELVQNALTLMGEALNFAESRQTGALDFTAAATLIGKFREFYESIKPEDGELWLEAQVQLIAITSLPEFRQFLETADDGEVLRSTLEDTRAKIDKTLLLPAAQSPQYTARLYQFRARSRWLPSGTLILGSPTEALNEYQKAIALSKQIPDPDLVREIAFEQFDMALALKATRKDLDRSLEILKAELAPAELKGRGFLARRMLWAKQADLSLVVQASQDWFAAWRSDIEAAHAPAWLDDEDRLRQEIYLAAPLLAKPAQPALSFERLSNVAAVMRSVPLTATQIAFTASAIPEGAPPGARQNGVLHPPEDGWLNTLRVDAIVMPVMADSGLDLETAASLMAHPNQPASHIDTLYWAVIARDDQSPSHERLKGLESGFDKARLGLNSLVRIPTSAPSDLLHNLAGDQPSPADPGQMIKAMRLHLSGQQELADNAFFEAFGAPIDGLFNGRCASQAPLDRTKAPRVLLILPAALEAFYPIPLIKAPSGRSLMDCYEIIRAPTLEIAAQSAQRLSPAYAVRTVGTIESPEDRLLMAKAEMALIPEALPGAKVIPIKPGDDRNLLGEHRKVDLLHIAGHGAAHWFDPHRSGVNLPGGRRLSVADLLTRRQRLDALVVVLSACEGGLSSPRFGPVARYSLPAALLESGVGGVIAAQWQVRDDVAVLVLSHFYELMAKPGARPAAALREAQLWLRKQSLAQLSAYIDEKEARLSPRERPSLSPLRAAVIIQARIVGDAAPYQDPSLWGAFAYFGAG